MAEKETDDTLEETSSAKGSSTLAFKGLSKPTLIKIAGGLLALLIIAGGAYFFFMSSDEASPEEAAIDTKEGIISPELTPPTLTTESAETESKPPNTETPPLSKEYTDKDIQLLKMREEAIALKEENLQMRERLSKLEAQQNPNVETSEAVVNRTSPESDKQVSEVVQKSKVKTNPYANLYSRDYTIVREPKRESKREPPPEPKWGNFDPLYRGK